MEIPDRDEYIGTETGKRDIWDIYMNSVTKGFIPIPLKGKVPLLKNWQNTTKENMLPNFTEGIRMGADNVGIVTGPASGIIVVDIDNKIVEGTQMTGVDIWNQVMGLLNLDVKTYTVMTGSGGYHFYFRYEGDAVTLRSAPISRHSVDIKTLGGQVVAPGSTHPETGKEYIIVNDVPISTMPPSLADYFFRIQNQ